jgi:hypothetical protein
MKLFDEIHSSCEADAYQPLLDFLRLKKKGRAPPPYIPKWDLMPIHKLCKLALLWQEAGFEIEARQLACWLFKLESFLPLWCSDKEYDEKEAKRLFDLLRGVEPLLGFEPKFNLELLNTSRMSSAITLDGNGTSLGIIRSGDLEIRAFGPQDTSFNFGIKGRGVDGWTRVSSFPEVWLEMKTFLQEDGFAFDFRFVGLKPESPIFLAFYVKGSSCQIGHDIFKPKSLKRFYGEARLAIFGDKLKIESEELHKVQLIPLAGEGCFWDCEFMLSFELHPFVNQARFKVFL